MQFSIVVHAILEKNIRNNKIGNNSLQNTFHVKLKLLYLTRDFFQLIFFAIMCLTNKFNIEHQLNYKFARHITNQYF